MSRKINILLSLMLIATFVLASCSAPATQAPATEVPPTQVPPTQVPPTEAPAPTEVPPTEAAAEPVEIRWFVGLGVGTNEQERATQDEVVAEFNASQNRIKLVLEVADVDTAYQTLATEITAGNAPDVVGPVGIYGRDFFKGDWLDINPLIEASKYDLNAFDPSLVEFFTVGDEMLGIPFGIYPSFIFVNKDLFDAAGLPYPPQEFGAPYVDENGVEHEWNFDTLREVAMKLTIDKDGNNATSPDFDPENIVQWGYDEQWTDLRGAGTMFGAGSITDEKGDAQIPANWLDAWKWLYDGRWVDHFVPTGPQLGSPLLNMEFASGNIALVHVHLWFSGCCMGDIKFKWDTAVVPTYNGTVTAKLHADTFEIMRFSKHPAEAFDVISYLAGPAAEKLTLTYSTMPARLSLQKDWFKTFNEKKFPGMEINWQVVVNSAAYNDRPSAEGWMPSFAEAKDRQTEFYNLMLNETGLDVAAKAEEMKADLQKIFEAYYATNGRP